ncbi:hypothetical protein [Thermofilum sp.]|jgi:hypothetical protein|uniref:hypothetical protein n=1 Tax=Thermofilum sp. TaxID=1961369 RepID=UPI00258FEA6C|nr:hypothetical protein [Thermofilum sp.]
MQRSRHKNGSPQNLEKKAKSSENVNSAPIKDPVEAIDGILADLEIDSDELQHKARELWASKITKDLTA